METLGKAIVGILILFLLAVFIFQDPTSIFTWIVVAIIVIATRSYVLAAILLIFLFDIFSG